MVKKLVLTLLISLLIFSPRTVPTEAEAPIEPEIEQLDIEQIEGQSGGEQDKSKTVEEQLETLIDIEEVTVHENEQDPGRESEIIEQPEAPANATDTGTVTGPSEAEQPEVEHEHPAEVHSGTKEELNQEIEDIGGDVVSEEDPPEETIEILPDNPFLMDSPQLSVDAHTVDQQLVLSLRGRSRSTVLSDSFVVFQFPDEWIETLRNSQSHAAYQVVHQSETGLSAATSGAFMREEHEHSDMGNQVIIKIPPSFFEEGTLYIFTLTITLEKSLQDPGDGMSYAQVVNTPTDLSGYSEQVATAMLTPSETKEEQSSERIEEVGKMPGESVSAEQVTGKMTMSQASIESTSRLTFSSVPKTLEFEDVYMVDEDVTVKRKDPSWSIRVNDSRGAGSEWWLYAEADRPLTAVSDPAFEMPGALVFIREDGSRIPLDNGAIEAYSGVTGVNQETEISWEWDTGPLLQFNPSRAQAGDYTTSIRWTLVDAP